MQARRYQLALNRQQQMLLPSSVEEYISENNLVRAIDAYVNTLNLQNMGFINTSPVITVGQPAYDPAA